MLDNLPDICLLRVFHHLPYDDRLRAESVSHRFQRLLFEVWNRKSTIVLPYDIRRINQNRYPISSYLTGFGHELRILVEHCPNAREIRFENWRRLQVFIQVSCVRDFARYPSLIESIDHVFIDSKYVIDVDMIRELARVFPRLAELSILNPFPLIHKLRSDTMGYLRAKIRNFDGPQLEELLEDNNRVTEDIRLLLELFQNFGVLRLRNARFEIVRDLD